MDRRNAIKNLGMGSVGISTGAMHLKGATSQSCQQATRCLSPVKITNVKAIATQPHGPVGYQGETGRDAFVPIAPGKVQVCC